jgi:hypothetical protein
MGVKIKGRSLAKAWDDKHVRISTHFTGTQVLVPDEI